VTGKGLNGLALGYVAVGGILIWSGVKGQTITETVTGFAHGQVPQQENPAYAVTLASSGGSGGSVPVPAAATSANAKANQAIARLLAAHYGWSTGAEWNALVDLWDRESGWNNLIANPTSGAFGIAQALGHGGSNTSRVVPTVYYPGGSTAHNVTVNEYPSAAANGGSATAQINWGLKYIKDTYGSPTAAWAHEEANGWY
jgi:hypothetical protein